MNAQDLKNSILQLAIQGKLVEQHEEEGTAKELLKQIKAEKEMLIHEKIIKRKRLPEILTDEIPFDIPQSWEWVRFGQVVNFTIGKTPQRSEQKYWGDDFNWVSIADMVSNGYVNETKEKISKAALNERFGSGLVPKDTLLMSFKLTIGKVSILNVDAVHNEAIISIYPYGNIENIFRNYLFTFLPLISTYGETKGAIKGKTLNSTSLNNLLIPLPPLKEQKRIVAKIEELMPYVDKYDKAYTEVEELNKKFPEDMQKSILQYAIQGKLVEQREEEATAEELYQRIQEEKALLTKEGKIKKTKTLSKITEDEIPFDIPESWKWVRFSDLAVFLNGDRGKNYPNKSEYVNEGLPWINTGHITKDGYLTTKTMNYITEEKYESLRGGKIQSGDLVYCLRGATFGKTARIEPYEKGAIASSLMIIRLIDLRIRDYIFLYLRSPIALIQLRQYDNGSAQPNLAAKDVAKYLIPLPPLGEQQRIVAKVEELLPYTKQIVN